MFDSMRSSAASAPPRSPVALRGLTGGALAAVMGGAFAANGTDARKKRKKKKCRAGLLKCTIGRGKRRKRTFCVDARNDPANCGSCGNACGGRDACNAPACNEGACGTTTVPDVPCNGGAGTCDAAGRCVAIVCAGKDSPNPCFEGIAAFCNAAQTCNCGTDLDGNVSCYENHFCLSAAEGNCASNADCVAKCFAQGSVCFSATNCCGSQTGCTTPCPT